MTVQQPCGVWTYNEPKTITSLIEHTCKGEVHADIFDYKGNVIKLERQGVLHIKWSQTN